MANIYLVSFKIGSFYHSNIALAENPEDVKAHYSEYEEVYISDGNEGDLREAERKGKPVITVEHIEEIKEDKDMHDYNYYEAIEADIRQYIEDNYTPEELEEMGREEAEEKLNDEMWTADEVTGNGSGSYTFSTYKAECYICHNLDLLAEAVEEFGGNTDVLKNGAEACDVTIRCYLLGQVLGTVLDEVFNQ